MIVNTWNDKEWAYQHTYLAKAGDTIQGIHKLNLYYDMSMLFAMVFPKWPILLFGIRLDDQHISMLNYLWRMPVHIVLNGIYVFQQTNKQTNKYSYKI